MKTPPMPKVSPPKDEPSIMYKGEKLPLSSLPKDVQDLFEIHMKWEAELATARVEVFKLEAAIRGLGSEIEHRLTELTKAD